MALSIRRNFGLLIYVGFNKYTNCYNDGGGGCVGTNIFGGGGIVFQRRPDRAFRVATGRSAPAGGSLYSSYFAP